MNLVCLYCKIAFKSKMEQGSLSKCTVFSNGTLLSICGEKPIVLSIGCVVWRFPWALFDHKRTFVTCLHYWKASFLTRDVQLCIFSFIIADVIYTIYKFVYILGSFYCIMIPYCLPNCPYFFFQNPI